MENSNLILIIILLLALYIVQAILLSKLNKLIEGQKTSLGWIPFANTYLLGKLTINDAGGWGLLLLQILSTGIIFENFKETFLTVYSIASLILFISAIIKYFRLKKEDLIYNASLDTPYDDMRSNMQGAKYQNLQTTSKLDVNPSVNNVENKTDDFALNQESINEQNIDSNERL